MKLSCRSVLSLFVFSMLFCNACAQDQTGAQEARTNEAHSFEKWKTGSLRKIARQKGLSDSFLDSVLPQIHYLPRVISSDKKQSEFLLSFGDYTQRTVSPIRVENGRKNAKEQEALVSETAQKYGVQPEILLAFWGMETNYGAYKGQIDTLNALATLAFDRRRRTFFTNELITLLRLIESGEKTRFNGSWAGAFGNFQFMPTTYAAYAVDADGDGQKDVINSLPDAFESAANYLSQMGWKADEPWGREVVLPDNMDWTQVPEELKLPVSAWRALGLVPACGNSWLATEENLAARLVMPEGVDGAAFLTYHNYDLMMRWNNSSLYALSVGLLSDQIKDASAKLCAAPVAARVSHDDVKYIQERLRQEGFYRGEIDGVVGKGTRAAIRAYQRKAGLAPDGYPSLRLKSRLKGD